MAGKKRTNGQNNLTNQEVQQPPMKKLKSNLQRKNLRNINDGGAQEPKEKKSVRFTEVNEVKVFSNWDVEQKRKKRKNKQKNKQEKKQMSKQKNKQLPLAIGGTHDVEDPDDRIIREMEKKLNMKKGDKLGKGQGDGLDELLDMLTSGQGYGDGLDGNFCGGIEMFPNDEDDFDAVKEKEAAAGETDGEDGSEDGSDVGSDVGSDDGSDNGSGDEGETSEEDEQEESTPAEAAAPAPAAAKFIPRGKRLEMIAAGLIKPDDGEVGSLKKKDATAATKTPSSNADNRFVAAIKRDYRDNAADAKVSAKVKLSLNKLNDANMAYSVRTMKSIIEAYGRGLVQDQLIEETLNRFDSDDAVLEVSANTFVNLIVIMTSYTNIGLLAKFVERLLKRFVEVYEGDAGATSGASEQLVSSKRSNNLLMLVCSLYEVKAIQKQLMFDVATMLCTTSQGGLAEKDAELLLFVLTKVGFQLRRDDTELMRNLVVAILASTKVQQEEERSSRMRHMIDVLSAVKNNNMPKIKGYQVGVIETRRKAVKNLTQSSTNDDNELSNVGLKDLLKADKHGRWWLVGSAWKGNQVEGSDDDDSDDEKKNKKKDIKNVDFGRSEKMIQLANRLRMNTDVRRKIFFAAMSSSDYQDAYENINMLGLKGKQERQIFCVLVESMQHQKKFNLFYAYTIQKFCSTSRDYVVMFQCALWDRFTKLKDMKQRHKDRISELIAHLLVDKTITIKVFKKLDFVQMNKNLLEFLLAIFVNIVKLSPDDVEAVADIFTDSKKKLANEEIKAMYLGLKFFVQQFIMKKPRFMEKHQKYRGHFEAIQFALR